MNYSELKTLINAYINKNGVQAITGQILNGVLNAMVDQLGKDYSLVGVATPTTDPGIPEAPQAWFASEPGVYIHFDGIVVGTAEIALLNYDGGWSKIVLSEGINDVEVTVDDQSGVPFADASYHGGTLTINFKNIKGNPGVQGPIGPAGVTSVIVTIDSTPGNPSCVSTINNGVLTLHFSGIKGEQGNTGVSADYPIAIVNNRYAGGTASAWSAEQGKLLSEEFETRLGKPVEMTPISTTIGKFYHDDGERDNPAMEYKLYPVNPGKTYQFSGTFHHLSLSMQFVRWLDEDMNNISGAGYHAAGSNADATYEDQMIFAPAGAVYAAFNIQITKESTAEFEVFEPIDFFALVQNVEDNTRAISEIQPQIEEIETEIEGLKEAVSKKTTELLTPSEDVPGSFVDNSGHIQSNAFVGYRKYYVDGGETYAFNGRFTMGFETIRYFAIYKADGTFIRTTSEYPATATTYINQEITMPQDAGYVLMNYRLSNSSQFSFSHLYYETISSSELEARLNEISGLPGERRTKVHVYTMTPSNNGNFFYVRAKYNETKDIILLYKTNYNSLIRPDSAYIGSKALTDAEIMISDNRVSSHTDSTAPLYDSTTYWHLFCQHGYIVPTINNTEGMTSADVGAIWEDQLSRRYTIGSVSSSTITLLPELYLDGNGHTTRGWKTPNSSTITTLTHISGGSVSSSFTVSGTSYVQIRPIMQHVNRHLLVDGAEITQFGDYYCKEFKVNESQTGYDPATITSWFPVDFTDAEVMAKFTWSYNFSGANCAVNTTIQILREVEFASYGATQQQTFFDVTRDGNTYKAMFLIPKAANDLDRPFNSPSSSSPTKQFFRTSSYLKDVNDPIDRLVAYLWDDVNDKYLVGMAAGLSLIKGDTVTAKRIQNIPIGNANKHYRLGSFSPENGNKFYIAAINTAPFEDTQYYVPGGYFKEIDYYVSYFDPAENPGQVYWYKDGSRYVVYIHTQASGPNMPITLPEVMEGLSLSIVEKTNDITLQSSSVQNGKVFVSVNTVNTVNYIVLLAQ